MAPVYLLPNKVSESTSHSHKRRSAGRLRSSCICIFLSYLESRFQTSLFPKATHYPHALPLPVNAAHFPASHMITNRGFRFQARCKLRTHIAGSMLYGVVCLQYVSIVRPRSPILRIQQRRCVTSCKAFNIDLIHHSASPWHQFQFITNCAP